MQKCIHLLIAGALSLGALTASAASLPTGYDEVRTASGSLCRSTTASDSYFQVATYAEENGDAGIKAEITIPLTGTRERLNCNRLYNLELERVASENEVLKAQLAEMKSRQTTWE